MVEMKKTFIFGLLLAFLCTSYVQGEKSRENVVSLGVNSSSQMQTDFFLAIFIQPGISIGYERVLNKYFSIGLDVGTNLLSPYAEIQGRYYPWSRMFFMGLGFGILVLGPGASSAFVPLISPEIGWKINIGKTDRLAIIPSTTGRLFLDNFPGSIQDSVFEICLKLGYKF
jgi:hypothetical protein